jgi:PAS domain S-box-containing protein
LIKNEELIREIQFRKQAEEALQASGATLRSIFKAAPTGIGLPDDRVIRQANERLGEILGYSQDELVGRNARLIYPTDEEFEHVGKEKYAQIREKGTGTIETQWQRKDG